VQNAAISISLAPTTNQRAHQQKKKERDTLIHSQSRPPWPLAPPQIQKKKKKRSLPPLRAPSRLRFLREKGGEKGGEKSRPCRQFSCLRALPARRAVRRGLQGAKKRKEKEEEKGESMSRTTLRDAISASRKREKKKKKRGKRRAQFRFPPLLYELEVRPPRAGKKGGRRREKINEVGWSL